VAAKKGAGEMTRLMLDTNVLSTAYLPRPPEWLWEWLESMPPGRLAIPWTTVYETEYGIRTAQRHNPAKAIELLAWFTEFLETRLTFPEMDVKASRLLGQMAATPALRHFFLTEDRRNKNGDTIKLDRIRLGGDAMLAALSISHQIPIATMNVRDFLYIHNLFPLPGLYNPKDDVWAVEPSLAAASAGYANDDHPGDEPDWIRRGPRARLRP
jgi:predicted nucleic acid-binding protein